MRFKDPLTGEQVSFSERASLAAQSVMRRWLILFGHIGFSVWYWSHYWHQGFSDPVNLWMAAYSLVAVLNESLIGIGQFGRGNRDTMVLRRVLRHLERSEEREYEMTALEGRILNIEQEVLARVRE